MFLFVSSYYEWFIVFSQLACYVNSYFMNLILLKIYLLPLIVVLNLIYFRSIYAFYMCNQTHEACSNVKTKVNKNKQKHHKTNKKVEQKQKQSDDSSSSQESSKIDDQNIQYCKQCKTYIKYRDHHCVFIGRCVEKSNYQYFLSYVIYSYILSIMGIFRFYLNFQLAKASYEQYQILVFFNMVGCLATSILFAIFTGALLASSIRSIIEGAYIVDTIKKKKAWRYKNFQFFKMCISLTGLKTLYKEFKQNWNKMVGQEVGITNILFAY